MFGVALFCIACTAYWWWSRKNAKTTEPPCLPGAWPLLGHVPLLIGDSCSLWNRINEFAEQSYNLGGVVLASIGPRTVYIVTDPDDSYTVATTCYEKDEFYDFIKPWLGDGLVTAKYSVWMDHRKLLNPAFSQIVLDRFMGVFNSQSRKLVKKLEKEVGNGPFDHRTYIGNNAFETIYLTALGVELTDSDPDSKYMEGTELAFSIILERIIKFWWHSPYTFAWSNLKKSQDACLKILHNISNTVLLKRKSEFIGNICTERSLIPGTKFKAFLDLLLELSVEKGVFTDREIREHVDTMIVAGHDTSAKVLMFTMTLLGSHPEAQEKVFTEIQEVLKEDRDVEKTDLSRMVYLEAVLKESMRVFTMGPVIARKLDRDLKLKNCTLSAGRSCFIFLFGIHKHPVWGPDAHEFKPERWLEPGKLPDNPKAFAAFSMGKRQCIGKAYAMMSMKTTLAHVVRRYRIKADHTKVRVRMNIILIPDAGHHISIERRT